MILSVLKKFGLFRHTGALVLLTLAAVACGCGPSAPTESVSTGKNAGKMLKEEQLYTYEGAGAAKKKVEISRRDRVKLLHEAAKKGE